MAECEKLAQNHYKNWRHDRVGKLIHWELCRKYGFDCTEKWYDHIPEGVLENERDKCSLAGSDHRETRLS